MKSKIVSPRRPRSESHKKVIADLRFMAEPLEARVLLYSYVTIQSPGATQPLQITSGQTVTLTADILQHDDVNTIQANPTGSVTFFWYPLKETSGPIIGTASNFTVITPFLDTQVTATFSLKSVSSFDGAAADNFGNYDILAGYNGDSNFPANISGSGFDNQILHTAADDQGRYVPVDFVTPSSGSIAVTRQPSNTPGGSRFDPSVQVSVLDSAGSVNTTSSASITVALASTSTGTGTLSGTKTVAAIDGVATFTDLTIDKPGQYSLTFTDPSGNTTASGLFNITGGKLVFLPPGPKDGSAGSPLKSFTVALEDAKGKVITSDSSTVVTLSPIGLKPNPTITGNVETLVGGEAVFSAVTLKTPDFYKLNAADGGDTEALSTRFKVTGDHLMIRRQPSDGNPNVGVPLVVGIYDAHNRLDTAASGSLQLSLNVLSGNPTVLGGTTLVDFAAGLATFTALSGPTIPSPGAYTLTATEEDTTTGALAPSNLTSPVTSTKFKIVGYHLKFNPQPATTDTDTPLQFTVTLLDSHNRPATSVITGGVALTLQSIPVSTGVLSAYSNIGFVQGVDEFAEGNSPSIDVPGKYKLTASATDENGAADLTIAPTISSLFQVMGLRIVFKRQPASQTVDKQVPFTLALEDGRGRLSTTQSPQVRITSSPDAGLVAGSPGSFANGLITFADSTAAAPHIAAGKVGSFKLTATAVNPDGSTIASIQPAISAPVLITPYHIAFIDRPENGTAFPGHEPFTVAIEDVHNHIQTDPLFSILSAFTLNNLDTGTSQAASVGTPPFTDGEVAFKSPLGLQIQAPGRYTITASATDLNHTPSTVVKPFTSNVFKIFSPHLVFSEKPQSIGGGFPLPPFTVDLQDDQGDSLFFSGYTVQISYTTTTDPTPVPIRNSASTGGPVTFSLVTLPQRGRYHLIASVIDAPAGNPFTSVTSQTISFGG